MLQKKIFYINSRNRLSGTNSDFEFKLDMKSIDPDKVVLLACNIPKSYYLIQSGSNTFTLQEGVSTATVTIPAGNYNRSQLKTVCQTQLNTASPNGYTYAITTPARTVGDTGYYTVTVTGNGGVQPDFIFSDNNMYEVLGFDVNSTNSFLADTLTSSNVIKLQKEDSVFIHSDICNNDGDNILQEVYSTSTSTFGNIVYYNQSPDSYSKNLTSNNGDIFHIYLTNEDGNPIDLNGQNWSATICVYKEDKRLFDFVREYAKILSG